LCENCPVRYVARDGAQTALLTKEFAKRTPLATKVAWMCGSMPAWSIVASEPSSRSSAMIVTMLGRAGAAGADWGSDAVTPTSRNSAARRADMVRMGRFPP
jgi:hypothetical protein